VSTGEKSSKLSIVDLIILSDAGKHIYFIRFFTVHNFRLIHSVIPQKRHLQKYSGRIVKAKNDSPFIFRRPTRTGGEINRIRS
jgi:hypothetical protein